VELWNGKRSGDVKRNKNQAGGGLKNMSEKVSEKQEARQKKDTRHRGWVFTVNNPQQIETVFYEYLKGLYNVRYFVFAKEQGDKGETPHYQGYIEFSEPKYFSKMKNDFSEPRVLPAAHLEPRKGAKKQAADYVRKTGEYADKKHTQTGEVYEYGKLPAEDGERSDLNDIMEDIEAGLTNIELVKKYGSKFISVRGWADEYRQDILTQKYSKERRLDLEVYYIYGLTNIGKTRYILDKYGDENVFIMSEYGNSFNRERFDGYKGERMILFEEFRSSIIISNMLRYLDVYKVQLPCRYSNKTACYNRAYITSNWALREQYKNIQTEHPDTWDAFLRRITAVYDFSKSKDIPIPAELWYPFKGNPKPQKLKYADLKPLSGAEQDELGF